MKAYDFGTGDWNQEGDIWIYSIELTRDPTKISGVTVWRDTDAGRQLIDAGVVLDEVNSSIIIGAVEPFNGQVRVA